MTELELKLTQDPELGTIVSHVESGPVGRVYQFRACATKGKLFYRWAPTNTPGATFCPWREIDDGIFPGVRELIALAKEGEIKP